MKYELDISGVQGTSLSPEAMAFKMPCKPGENQLNFDVIECDVPRDIYQEIVAKAIGYGNVEAFPIGFNTIPIGATIKRVG